MGEDIAKMIRQTRKNAGLTQIELADLAGVAKNLVYELEKGKDSIRFSNLVKILTVLNIQIQFVHGGGQLNA